MTVRSLAVLIGYACLGMIVILSALPIIFPSGGISGMLAFLAIPLSAALFIGAALFAVVKRIWVAVILVSAAALFIVPVVLTPAVPRTVPTTSPTHTLLWLNARHSHRAVDQIFEIDRKLQADVIAIAEAPVNWKARYARQLSSFPCIEWRRSEGAARLLILSRSECTPFVDTSEEKVIDNFRSVDRADGLRVIAIHAPRPFDLARILHFELPWSHAKLSERNKSITSAAIMARLAPHAILMGDFNAVAWSPPLTGLSEIGLQAIPCGPVWQSTWVDKTTGLGVPIDHVYMSQGSVATCNIGGDIGSDHRPLIVRIYGTGETMHEQNAEVHEHKRSSP